MKVIWGCLRGAGGAPVATRGGGVSKSATKALRAGIGREEKRGISTFLLARSGSIGAFVADLDKLPPQAGWGGRLSASAGSTASASARVPARRAVTDRADAPFDRAGPARAPPDPRAGAPARENGG